jgi:hypothetical protein
MKGNNVRVHSRMKRPNLCFGLDRMCAATDDRVSNHRDHSESNRLRYESFQKTTRGRQMQGAVSSKNSPVTYSHVGDSKRCRLHKRRSAGDPYWANSPRQLAFITSMTREVPAFFCNNFEDLDTTHARTCRPPDDDQLQLAFTNRFGLVRIELGL